MTIPYRSAAFLAIVALESSARGEDWKTSDGKVYEQVRVIRVEADAVTILDRQGGALVYLADLPADLQKRFNYDPEKAKLAAAARASADAENAETLKTEAAAAKKKQAMAEARDKAARAAAGAAPNESDNALPAGQFGLGNRVPDTRHHYETQDALSKDPH